jgi:hypothetical protein
VHGGRLCNGMWRRDAVLLLSFRGGRLLSFRERDETFPAGGRNIPTAGSEAGMPSKKQKKSPTAVPFEKFMGNYAGDLRAGLAADQAAKGHSSSFASLFAALEKGECEPPRPIVSHMLWDEVEQWWPVRLLRAAADQNDREAYKRLLHFWLCNLHVPPPEGVLTSFRWKRGRPQETEMIHAAWVSQGRPPLDWRRCDELAKTFYKDEFAKAKPNSKFRKNLRDRVRATIRRHEPVATRY